MVVDTDMALRRAGSLVVVLLLTMALYFLLVGDLRPAGLMGLAAISVGAIMPRARPARTRPAGGGLARPRRG